MNPDKVAVDTWYQVAVMRVYAPWLDEPRLVPSDERSRASSRVEHARVMLALRNVNPAPFLPPAIVVAFNPRDILQ